MRLKDDLKRYRYLVTLHTICTISFIIRFIVLCTDLSSAQNDAVAFPVIILLLELGSSLISFIGNLLYLFLRYLGPILFESDREKVLCCSQSFTWSFSTLTCIRCQCCREHPQLILLTRFCIFLLFEVMQFTAFILACVCANRYSPIGLGYSILAGFTLIPALYLLYVEYLHYRRLWFNYRPDTTEKNPKYFDHHMRFIPLSITNDQQTSHWQSSRCPQEKNCVSKNLYHVIMYHSGSTRYPPSRTMNGQTVVGFHQTSHAAASCIAKEGFIESKKGWIGKGVYFATSLNHTEFKANQFGAYICAKIDLGKTKRVKSGEALPLATEYDTFYLEHDNDADEFCVHNLDQIRSWIIVIDQDPNEQLLLQKNNQPLPSGKYVEDRLEAIVYDGCLL